MKIENNQQEYWDSRYIAEGKIWGEQPSISAGLGAEIFRKGGVNSVLVPGAGYGRHTKYFSNLGFDVTGIEISATALRLAKQFDPKSRFYQASVLDMSADKYKYEAIYCFNVLHLFISGDREVFINECEKKLKSKGLMFFTVFSENEDSFGRGKESEPNTFESKQGRPVHYFTETDLKNHFKRYKLVAAGIVDDSEDHGGKQHTHNLRYICLAL